MFDESNKDWTLHQSDIVSSVTMNFMGSDVKIDTGRLTGAFKTSAQDVFNEGYGLSLGKTVLQNPQVVAQLTNLNKDASISPIDIKLTFMIEGEVKLKKVGQNGIYEGAVISSVDVTDLRYGSLSGGGGSIFEPETFTPSSSNPCPDNMVQDSINKECVPEDPQNEGQPLPKSNEQKSKIPGMIKVTGIDKIGTPRPSNRCLVLVSSSLPRNIHSKNNFSAYNTTKITGRQIAPDANATKSPSTIGTL